MGARWLALRWVTLGCVTACGGEVIPTSGEWLYDNDLIIDNSCGEAADYEPVAGGFDLDNLFDGTFKIDPNDGGENFRCTLDRREFTCPERLRDTIELTVGANAEVTATVSGRFSSDTEASGEQVAVLRCVDAGCQSVASLASVPDPCSITVEFDASLAP